jgi:hypothetical protein
MDSSYAFKRKRFRNTRYEYLEYRCKALFETPCITSASHSGLKDLHASGRGLVKMIGHHQKTLGQPVSRPKHNMRPPE